MISTDDPAWIWDAYTVAELEVVLLLARALATMDERRYPPAPPRRPWVNPRRAHAAKLTEHQRAEVVRRYNGGEMIATLAPAFGVSESTISRTLTAARRAAPIRITNASEPPHS